MDYDIIEDGINNPNVQDIVFGIMRTKYNSGKDILEQGLGVRFSFNYIKSARV